MSGPVNIHPHHHRRTSSVLSHSAFSWSDAFEFSTRSPLSSAVHLDMEIQFPAAHAPQVQQQPLSFAPALGANAPSSANMSFGMACSPPTEEFEKDYCSNFACCNVTLPDMHALIAHCEEAHFQGGFQNSPYAHPCLANSAAAVAAVPTKPPVLNVDTTNAVLVGVNANVTSNVNMDLDIESSAAFGESMGYSHDAPSPYSSVGPETPPPQAFEVADSNWIVLQQNKIASSPEMERITAPMPMYGSNGSMLAVFPHIHANGRLSAPIPPFSHMQTHAPPLANSPLSSSPLSSPASYHSSGPATTVDDVSIPALQISSVSASVQGRAPAPADILMHFDPFDDLDDLPTPLDSTPPSPLSAPMRVRPVLRHASLVQPVSNCPSIGLPPSLFSTYDFMRVESREGEAEMDEEFERKEREREAREKDERRRAERRERDRERRERQRAAERERLVVLAALNGKYAANDAGAGASSAASGGPGGVVRREREKARKSSTIGLVPTSAGSRSVPVSPIHGSFAEERRTSEPSTSLSGETTRAERAAAVAANANGKRGVREKAYKCMKPGCTKSYLNPNGLKYHMLKGTCTFAEKPNDASAATPSPTPDGKGTTTPISSTPAGSAPGTPAPPVQLPVPFAIPTMNGDNATAAYQPQQPQALPQGFPAFSMSGVPIMPASMPQPIAPAGMTA